jgi:hypothetical protein
MVFNYAKRMSFIKASEIREILKVTERPEKINARDVFVKSLFEVFILITLTLALFSCESHNFSDNEYLFKTDGGLEYKYNNFELYDSSTHIFYFKTSHPEFYSEKSSTFTLFANGEESYEGVFWSFLSSSLPYGPCIYSPSFYPDYTFRIELTTIDNLPADTRNEPAFIKSLKNHNLLHSGLSSSINSIDIAGSLLTFKFTVTNKDESTLLILDPEKMGSSLFHYYTNEPVFFNTTEIKVYNCSIDHERPSSNNFWSIDWLSELKSGDSRQFSFNYTFTSTLKPGVYKVSYEFPGLTHQVSRDQLYQNNLRIWLGDVTMTSSITIH